MLPRLYVSGLLESFSFIALANCYEDETFV